VIVRAGWASLALALATPLAAQTVTRVADAPASLKPLPTAVGGRVQRQRDGGMLRQWPGTYFETAWTGPEAFFRIGQGEVSLRIRADDGKPVPLVKPDPGTYRISGLGAGAHRLRIDIVSEDQKNPSAFGGFFAGAGTRPAQPAHRARAIEFIGDSHTVGYGNISPTRTCTEGEVWSTTDTSQGVAPLAAARYNADYQVNAISGRGIVRNYNGSPAPTLPAAYPFTLFDRATPFTDKAWAPQVIVIALGTNDFSTPLHPGEKWTTREDLRADFEASYVRFVQGLRARNPKAYFVLWTTDFDQGELEGEVRRVAERLQATGERRLGFVPVRGLAFSACNRHPGLADDKMIAASITAHIDAHPEIWASPPGGKRR
jgi:lysophospholipase L1-like esterase